MSLQATGYVTYVTAGGGGALLYDVEPTIYHAVAKAVYHFCVFHIKGDTFVMDTIDIDGRIIDHLEVTKRDGCLNKQYRWTAVPVSGIQLRQRLHENLDVVLSEVPEKDRLFAVNVRMTLRRAGRAEHRLSPPRCGSTADMSLEAQTSLCLVLWRFKADRPATNSQMSTRALCA